MIRNTIFGAGLAAAALFAAAPLSAAAQTIRADEEARPYFQDVRGWDVVSVWSSEWGFQGCRAYKSGPDGMLILNDRAVDRTAEGAWELIVPTNRSDEDRFDGAVVIIDENRIDTQFGFQNGWAIRELSETEFDLLKAGSTLTVDINNDTPRSWALSGSTAASLKTYECMTVGGDAPKTKAEQKAVNDQIAASQQSPFLYEPPMPAGLSVGDQMGQATIGDCQYGFGDSFRCLYSHYKPQAGYKLSYRIDDAFEEQPSLIVNVTDSDEIEVGYSFDQGATILDAGVWEIYGKNGKCMRPKKTQKPIARQNLGQDAWQICAL